MESFGLWSVAEEEIRASCLRIYLLFLFERLICDDVKKTRMWNDCMKCNIMLRNTGIKNIVRCPYLNL